MISKSRNILNLLESKKIDWDDVMDAAKEIAKEAFGDVDNDILKDMINKIKKMKNVKDTEDAIGVIQNMISS